METKKLSLSAICAAVTVVILYIGSLVKTGTLAIYFVCSLAIMTVVDKAGKKYGIMTYAVSLLLSWILIADKTIAAAYTAIFGIFPIIKAVAEKSGNRITEWIIKIIAFNVAFAVCIYVIGGITGKALSVLPLPVLWIGANAFFVVYDILLSFGYTRLKQFLKF